MGARGCAASYETDQWYGYGCKITEGPCEFIYPSSKACAEKFGEGPDAYPEEQEDGGNENAGD